VNALVRLEVEIEREFFPAYLALVRLLPGVNEHVPLEFGVVEEALLASLIVALELSIG